MAIGTGLFNITGSSPYDIEIEKLKLMYDSQWSAFRSLGAASSVQVPFDPKPDNKPNPLLLLLEEV